MDIFGFSLDYKNSTIVLNKLGKTNESIRDTYMASTYMDLENDNSVMCDVYACNVSKKLLELGKDIPIIRMLAFRNTPSARFQLTELSVWVQNNNVLQNNAFKGTLKLKITTRDEFGNVETELEDTLKEFPKSSTDFFDKLKCNELFKKEVLNELNKLKEQSKKISDHVLSGIKNN